MTEKFISKRIMEQRLYIWDIANSALHPMRKKLLVDSAKGQLEYFETKLDKIKA